jgi:hypothetical protein
MDGVTISSSPSSKLSTAGPSGMKLSVKPRYVSHPFAAKVKASGLPPVRFMTCVSARRPLLWRLGLI